MRLLPVNYVKKLPYDCSPYALKCQKDKVLKLLKLNLPEFFKRRISPHILNNWISDNPAFVLIRGRIIIMGDVGINLGDSMYDGTIYVGGKIGSYGSDAIESPMTKSDIDWIKRKLKVAEIGENFDVSKMTKVVAGKKLWNYDALEPTEKKGAI